MNTTVKAAASQHAGNWFEPEGGYYYRSDYK